jgi:hypothetical protein
MTTQPNSSSPVNPDAGRCLHRTPTGRRCKLSVFNETVGLCQRHAASHQRNVDPVLTEVLAGDANAFLSAKGINRSLMQLHTLLVKDMISTRRAAVLAYITSLLLRTLPAMEEESAVPEPKKQPLKIIWDIPHPPHEDEPPPPTVISK